MGANEMTTFNGFEEPKENWSKLPHAFIGALPLVETEGELKVILYILRHTWGFQDTEKKITLDEFKNGRKRRDRTRLDAGTGLSKPTIIDGLERAEQHGFINVEVNDSDKARVKKLYSLRMSKDFTPDVKELDTSGKEPLQRSEKETLERNPSNIPAAGVLETAVAFDKELFGAAASRPKGWRACSEDEYAICERVAQHWRNGILPGQTKFIEESLAGAAELLTMFNGEGRETLKIIDEFHRDYRQRNRDFTVKGPSSLVNEIPAFLSKRKPPGPPPRDVYDDPQAAAFRQLREKQEKGNDSTSSGNGTTLGNTEPQGTGNSTGGPRRTVPPTRYARP
jgi:hypothetical protein